MRKNIVAVRFLLTLPPKVKMNGMKRRIKIIVSLVAALLAAGIVACILYGKRVGEWRQVADHTLRNAIKKEVNKRVLELGENIPYSSHGNYKTLVESDFPLTVEFTTEQGNKQYTIKWKESQRNIAKDRDTRTKHTVLFLNHPLSPDTLSRNWNDSLRLAGFSGKGLLRVCTLDMNSGERHCMYAGDSLEVAQADSLLQLNIGYVCEIEVAGFLSYHWWQVYAVADWGILLFLLLCGIVVALLWCKLSVLRERYFVKTVEVEKVVEKVIEVEKPVMVATMELSQATCYQLPDGTLFDRVHHVLKKGSKQKTLTAQDCTLLWLLVEAKDEGVAIERLKETLWSSKIDSNNAVYANISRLRKNLEGISSLSIKNAHGYYHLILTKEGF